MKRRVLCLILAVIMVAYLLPTAAFASTNGKTADDAINWVRSLNGQPVGSGECVALIKAYYSYLGQTSPGGNGADYSWNQLPAGWQRLPNEHPQKGDILVYSGNGANPAGHVAIYESDYSTWHQNFASQRKVVNVTNIRYNGFDNPYWGVIRPDFGSAVFKPDFIDIGTSVYRYIIRADKWMPTGTCYDQNAKRDVKIVNSGSSDPNMIWLFTRMGFDNSYVILNAYNNYYLSYEGNCASQAKITTSDKLTSKCYWYVAYYNGLCKLVAKDSVASGNWLVIDCKDGSSTPGTQLQLYGNWGPNDSNGNAQLFNIYTVENYQQPPKPPKVELTVPDVVTVGEEFTISWTPSPLQGKYDQREYEVHIRKGGSGFKTIYTTDTSVTLTLTKPDTSYNVYLTVYNRKYQDYSSSAFATFRCIRETAHEHSYTAVVTPPTCTERGYTTHTCSCGHSYVDTYTDALGHAWDSGKVTKQPTATETGIKTFTCTRCSATKTETIPVLSHTHSYKAVVTAPTCTAKGYTTHTCSCGHSYVDTYTDALGHAWDGGTVTKQPTATEAGIKTFTCTRCSATKTETIPATGGGCPTAGFTDAPPEGNWAHAGLDYCVQRGILSGVGDGRIDPSGLTTRAQFVQMLYSIHGKPAVSGALPFTDLPEVWYRNAILWAYQTGVTSGTSDTTFSPYATVTRAQVATFLMKYAKTVCNIKPTWTPADLSKYPDVNNVPSWALGAMQDAVALGLISGNKASDGTVYLDPNGNAPREQVATILMQFCKNVKK